MSTRRAARNFALAAGIFLASLLIPAAWAAEAEDASPSRILPVQRTTPKAPHPRRSRC
jgi:hypothetical protein